MIRNIDKMYYNFGYCSGGDKYCHQCSHFRKECWNKKSTKKVIGYDEEGKEIIERESFLACGLIDKPFPKDETIPGQMKMPFMKEG